MDIKNEFPFEVREKAVKITNYVSSQVSFVPWDVERMRRSWRRRSLQQILDSGEVNYCVPCIDTAALAVKYLAEQGERASVVVYTDKLAAKEFLDGGKSKLHIDAAARFWHDGKIYGLDIGSCDITLLRGAGRFNGNGQEYFTTRYDEPIWERIPLTMLRGETLIIEKDKPVVDLLCKEIHGTLSLGIRKEDFYRVNESYPDGDNFFEGNVKGFDKGRFERHNFGWMKSCEGLFPGLKPFVYHGKS